MNDEVSEILWTDAPDLGGVPVTPGLQAVITRAQQLLADKI
jgi:hypothetical protein